MPGIFACGDVRLGPIKSGSPATVGEGSMAIAFVHQYLREQEPSGGGAQPVEPRPAAG